LPKASSFQSRCFSGEAIAPLESVPSL